MNRLTQKDEQGNWCLKGLAWEQLHVGQVITREVSEALYGALWKLMEYEDTGLFPERVEELNDFEKSQCTHLMEKLYQERKKHQWIPVEERLPEKGMRVLVACDDGVIRLSITGGKSVTGSYIVNGFPTGINLRNEVFCVIAWMPLPEPYRPAD